MAMKFDEVKRIIDAGTLGKVVLESNGDKSKYRPKENLLITDDGLLTGPEQLFFILDELEDTYSPVISLTKEEKDMLLYYLENYNFSSLLERISSSKSATMFGIGTEEDVPFNGLSEEDLMQAWLYPRRIKVREVNKDDE